MPRETKLKSLIPIIVVGIIFIFFVNGIDYLNLFGKLSGNVMFGRDYLINYNVVNMIANGSTDVYNQSHALKNCEKLGILPTQPFNYPPFLLVVYYPFAYFAPKTAMIIMLALNHILLFLSVFLLLRSVGITGWKVYGSVFLLSLLSASSIDSLFAGQINYLILFLISLFLYFYGNDKKGASALFLGMAAALKLIPAIILLYLFFKRDFRTMVYTIASFIGFSLLPALIWGRGILLDYLAVHDRYLFISLGYENQSVRAFFLKFFTSNGMYSPIFSSDSFAIIGWIAVSALLILPFWKVCNNKLPEEHSKMSDLLGLSSTLLLGMLILSFSWSHHSLWAIPAIIYSLVYLFEKDVRFDILAGFACLTLIYSLFDGTVSARYNILLLKNYPMLYHSGMIINILLFVFSCYLLKRMSGSQKNSMPKPLP